MCAHATAQVGQAGWRVFVSAARSTMTRRVLSAMKADPWSITIISGVPPPGQGERAPAASARRDLSETICSIAAMAVSEMAWRRQRARGCSGYLTVDRDSNPYAYSALFPHRRSRPVRVESERRRERHERHAPFVHFDSLERARDDKSARR